MPGDKEVEEKTGGVGVGWGPAWGSDRERCHKARKELFRTGAAVGRLRGSEERACRAANRYQGEI